jgi:hypothetical protein
MNRRTMTVAGLAFAALLGASAGAGATAPDAHRGYSPSGLLALGHAQQEVGQVGAAIASFERGRLLAPRDPELREALARARADSGAQALPESPSVQLARTLSLREWSALVLGSAVATALLALAVAAFPRKRALAALLVAGLAAGGIALAGYVLARESLTRAIVLDPGTSLRRSPFATAKALQELGPGVEVELAAERHAGFLYVTSPTGEQGWLAAEAVAPLAAPGRS